MEWRVEWKTSNGSRGWETYSETESCNNILFLLLLCTPLVLNLLMGDKTLVRLSPSVMGNVLWNELAKYFSNKTKQLPYGLLLQVWIDIPILVYVCCPPILSACACFLRYWKQKTGREASLCTLCRSTISFSSKHSYV